MEFPSEKEWLQNNTIVFHCAWWRYRRPRLLQIAPFVFDGK